VLSDAKVRIKSIIERLTTETRSIFSEKVFSLAAELGIGESHVKASLQELVAENFITEPMHGVLRRVP